MKTTTLAVLVCAALAGGCAQLGLGSGSASQGQSAGRAAGQDVKMMENIAQANLAEIETGKMAVGKAQSPAVKQFAQHMIDDHTKMLQEGAQLAKSKGMPVPKSPDLKHQALAKKLEMMSGASFDRAYMEQMVKDHADTLQLLDRTVAEAQDADLRQLAQKAIPSVRQHLDMARRLAGDLVGSR